MEETVIARASADRPLIRIVMGVGRGVVYLANPASLDSIRSGQSRPVAFPASDVFIYDDGLAGRLLRAWDTDGEVSTDLWGEAVPWLVAVAT